ncbi:MAG: Gfo/Idh/MocA family oxidoreductase [Propionibacteriaceae bacterium]|nr:Gfo/Idh/MocA family oxidoreductase [Propionibacteriaceae bacterium]
MTSLPTSRIADPRASAPLKWGILGPGWIAAAFTAALATHTDQKVVAVGSRSGKRAAQFAAKFGIDKAYSSYEQLVSDPQVQAVYVASPHSEHHAHTLLAIDAGKHVLVEKAFARNGTEATEMVTAARTANLTLMEAMWTRFLPRTDIVRQLLEAETLGIIHTFIADHGQALTHVARLVEPQLAGGALLDLGIYPISYANFVFGVPRKVQATGKLWESGVDAQVSAVLSDFPGNTSAQALVNTSMLTKTPTTATICGTKARIELDGDFYAPGNVRLVYPNGTAISSPAPLVLGHQGLCHEAAHFADLVANGQTESGLLPLDETVAIMGQLDAIRAQLAC